MSRYIDDVLSLNNRKFVDHVDRIYPPELKIKDATDSSTSAAYLDIYLQHNQQGQLTTKLYDKRDDFDFPIVEFPFLNSNIPTSRIHGVYMSQLIRYPTTTISAIDRVLTNKLTNQGFKRCRLMMTITLAGTYSNPTCAPGRNTIVHLFEWKWSDIAQECERFLGPNGFCGVQISPPNENRVVSNRPWWERYQPVSYKLTTRSGNEGQLRDMVTRCNKVNVRIYADTVINHMTGVGGSGTGTAGSHWDGNSLSYPGVPFSAWDFNSGNECHSSDMNIHDYNNAEEVRNCRLVSLADLKVSKNYVREEIAGYMNHLIDMGVAGFRVDAAKHMWPGDLRAIFGKLHSLNSGIFGSGRKPFIFQEVIDMGGEPISASEYTGIARVTNFIFGVKLGQVFRNENKASYLHTWGESWNMPNSNDVVVFIDNHDNQRGHGGGGGPLTHFEPRPYKLATAFMLAHPYGFTRLMSSYNFDRSNTDQGPPHNGDNINDVTINADQTCGNGWTCEHRWREIYNMVAFRNVVMGQNMQHWWDNGNYQIAFGRGDKGFIALNMDNNSLDQTLQTGLPEGTYCDVISGSYDGSSCSGTEINVGHDGNAHFSISNNNDDPMIAIHIGAKKGQQKKVTT